MTVVRSGCARAAIFGMGVALVLAGCATPHVVDVRQAGDANLSCEQILSEIEEANQFEAEARGERRVTGTNVAAAVFFWPGLVGTYMNTEDAIKAAQDRRAFLTRLHEDNGC